VWKGFWKRLIEKSFEILKFTQGEQYALDDFCRAAGVMAFGLQPPHCRRPDSSIAGGGFDCPGD
jgi:hypothetical protein